MVLPSKSFIGLLGTSGTSALSASAFALRLDENCTSSSLSITVSSSACSFYASPPKLVRTSSFTTFSVSSWLMGIIATGSLSRSLIASIFSRCRLSTTTTSSSTSREMARV